MRISKYRLINNKTCRIVRGEKYGVELIKRHRTLYLVKAVDKLISTLEKSVINEVIVKWILPFEKIRL